MLSEKLKKMIEIADQAGNSSEIEIWTSTFKARGTLLKDANKAVEGIVSLINARMIPTFTESEGPLDIVVHNWLNIFEDEIIAFTVINPK